MAGLRWLMGAVALTTVVAAGAGCTPDAEPAPPTPAPSATPDPVTLDLAVHGDSFAVDTWHEIADAFAADSPELRIDISAEADPDTSVEVLRKQFEEGEEPDVFVLHQDWLAEFVEAGRLQPVDTLLEDRGLQFGDDYQRVALTTFSADSALQCMPAEMSPLVLFYNRKLMPRRALLAQGVALPDGVEVTQWSWADMVAAALAMDRGTRGAAQAPVHSIHLPPDVDLVTALLRSAGADVVDDVLDPTRLTLASDEAIEVITAIAALTRDNSLSPTAEQVAATDPLEMFLEGRLGMYVGTRADVPTMRATEGLRFDVLPLPTFDRARAVAPATGLCISSESEHVPAAADFIAFATGAEGAAVAARSGGMVPSVLDSIVSDEFAEGEQPRNPAVFVTSVRRSDLLPYAVAWPDVTDRVERLLNRILLNPKFDVDERLVPVLLRANERSEQWFDPSLVEDESDEETSTPSAD